ncbi:MAG: hypothetical protein ACI9T7_003179 [Oleiphilaceae bacterium]|jgi:hypothetical protein
MQGKKDYQEQLFTSFQLSNHVPKFNFYRRLSEHLDVNFVRSLTKEHYGTCGQKSLDPVVFCKLSIVGCLENIICDRKLIDHCSMRIRESTLSKTKRYCWDRADSHFIVDKCLINSLKTNSLTTLNGYI